MIQFLIAVIVIVGLIIGLAVLNKNDKKSNKSTAPSQSAEFYRTMASLNRLSYKQLDKIHTDLLPLCNKRLISGLVYYDDSIPYEKKEEAKRNMERSIGKIIPENKRVYGCVTYDDAHEMNQAVLRQMDKYE